MDILNDQSQKTWYQICTKYASAIPDFVLDAEYPTKEAAANLTNREFADEIKRAFPIDSPANIWFSAAYFAKCAEEAYKPGLRDFVEARIKFAADTYRIRNDVEKIMEEVRNGTMTKAAAADTDFGWVGQHNGQTVRRYPMFDVEGVKKANAYFAENRFKYPDAMRRTIAAAIMQKCAQYDVTPCREVRVEAGAGMPRRDTLMDELLYRSRMAKDAECSMVVANLNNLIAAATPEEFNGMADKIAEVISALDEVEGFRKEYGKTLLAPADIVYDMSIKQAEELVNDSVQLGKYTFSTTKLAELDVSIYGDVLGDDFVERIKSASGGVDRQKLADELYSLPIPDKRALEDHLRTLGG